MWEDLQITNRLLYQLSYVGPPVKIVAEDSLRAIAALDHLLAPFPLHMNHPDSPQERVVFPLAIEPQDS